MMIPLPWPDKRLNPNARVHWRPLAVVKADAKDAAFWQTKASLPMADRARVIAGDGRIPMTVTFYPPDARHRDDDNMVASFKAARDGIAAALGCDDRRFRPHYIFADPCKPGRVEVAFTGETL